MGANRFKRFALARLRSIQNFNEPAPYTMGNSTIHWRWLAQLGPRESLEKSVQANGTLTDFFKLRKTDWVRTPNVNLQPDFASVAHHTDFDDDPSI